MITLGMLSCLYLLKLLEDGKDWLYCVKAATLCSTVWFIGYGCTWVSKWVLYDLTANSANGLSLIEIPTGVALQNTDSFSMLSTALKQVLFRISRTHSSEAIYAGRHFFVTLSILGRTSLYIILVTGIVLYVHKFKAVINGFNKTALSFMLIAFLSAAWYIVLANHTISHSYFTFRQSFVFMLGMLLAINEILFAQNINPISFSPEHDNAAPVPAAEESEHRTAN